MGVETDDAAGEPECASAGRGNGHFERDALCLAQASQSSRCDRARRWKEPVGVVQDTLIESDYRREEYRVFCRDIQDGFPKNNLLIRSSAIESYGDVVSRNFERISLMHKLRETRAFVGFSRLYPDNDLT